METAVGIFDSRERAEQAMKELLIKHIPQEDTVFLTRSETEAHTLGKEIGTYAGGFAGGAVGMAAGVAAVALALVQAGVRRTDGVTIVDLPGRIAIGEGTLKLREVVKGLLDEGRKQILLKLSQVNFVDSTGIGELVRSFTTVRNSGGQMELTNPSQRVQDLLEVTYLNRVFDIYKDEASAVRAFGVAGARATAN
jgi:anti-sigma B factor antagonist